MFRFALKAGKLGSKICKFHTSENIKLARMMHSLIKNKAFINGKWTAAADNKSFNVTNPANQKVVAVVPDMGVADVQKAIDSAYDAFHSKDWQRKTAKERSDLLEVCVDTNDGLRKIFS